MRWACWVLNYLGIDLRGMRARPPGPRPPSPSRSTTRQTCRLFQMGESFHAVRENWPWSALRPVAAGPATSRKWWTGYQKRWLSGWAPRSATHGDVPQKTDQLATAMRLDFKTPPRWYVLQAKRLHAPHQPGHECLAARRRLQHLAAPVRQRNWSKINLIDRRRPIPLHRLKLPFALKHDGR